VAARALFKPETKPPAAEPEAPTRPATALALQDLYPVAGSKVSGLRVRTADPEDIESARTTMGPGYNILPGIREVQLSAFRDPPQIDLPSNKIIDARIAKELERSGEITPGRSGG